MTDAENRGVPPIARLRLAASLPAFVPFAVFLAIGLAPRPVVPEQLKFANEVVNWLSERGVEIERVAAWSHSPFPDRRDVVTMRTGTGWVQVLVLATQDAASQFELTETRPTGLTGLYFYRGRGLSNDSSEVTWESAYPWRARTYRNWILFTTDPATGRVIDEVVAR